MNVLPADVHREITAYVTEAGPSRGAPPSVAAFREEAATLLAHALPRLEVRSVQDVVVAPPESLEIAVRIYHPRTEGPAPILVWAHGGYWVRGDLDSHDALLRVLCRQGECIVISADYRRAPEARFPAAISDVYGATRWAAANAESIGGRPGAIAVGGDGAGANLAAAATLVARGHGDLEIAQQVLMMPILDLTLSGPSWDSVPASLGVPRPRIEWALEQYAPGVDRRDALLSPLAADSHRDLPPALVLTAEHDPFCDDGSRYAQALDRAGVDVELVQYVGLIHEAFLAAGAMRPARVALADAASRLRERLVSSG